MRRLCFCLVCMLLVYVSVPALATITPTNFCYGSWLPYWETSASLEEANEMQNQMDTFVAFACLFDNKDNLLMPNETVDLLTALKESHSQDGKNVYLSVVNDIEVSPGKYDNKSAALLRRLFQSEETRSRHMEQLAELIDTYGLKGIELDYENIKYDTGLWSSYTLFIEKIWAMCQRDGINLRIVLPWDAPLYADLPIGPEYTVMCYNLYGYHSGPGPKADLAFLEKLCELYENAPFTVRMAFATGGFDWSGGTIDALTQEQAQKQLQSVQYKPTRDEASGALTAVYKQDGKEHKVWYADAMTLCIWQNVCASYGFSSFDLFRLGGNDVENLKSVLFNTNP